MKNLNNRGLHKILQLGLSSLLFVSAIGMPISQIAGAKNTVVLSAVGTGKWCWTDGIIKYSVNHEDKQAKVYQTKDGQNLNGVVNIPSCVIVEGEEYIVNDIEMSFFSYCKEVDNIIIPDTIERCSFQDGILRYKQSDDFVELNLITPNKLPDLIVVDSEIRRVDSCTDVRDRTITLDISDSIFLDSNEFAVLVISGLTNLSEDLKIFVRAEKLTPEIRAMIEEHAELDTETEEGVTWRLLVN